MADSHQKTPSLADCARSWLADSGCTEPLSVATYASGWSMKSWETVARRKGFDGLPTKGDMLDALADLRGVTNA